MGRILTVAERMQGIQALVCDVDGVLTDGQLHYFGEEELKSFSAHDGFGFTLAKQVDWRLAMITARSGRAVTRRAEELGVTLLSGERRKGAALERLARQWQLPLSAIAYIGDDWIDLPALAIAGLAATVPNAAPAVRQRAHWQASLPGGQGAVRELIEAILRVQGHLEPLLARYQAGEGV